MRRVILILYILIFFACETESQVNTDRMYTNPVGDNVRMGDPFVMLYNNTYYLYGTNASKDGFICWSSPNLRDWKNEGYAYRAIDSTYFGTGNFWAPEVIYYNGSFYMTYSCNDHSSPKRMLICLAESKSPAGPFIDKYTPLFDKGFSCIDGHVFIDENKIYLYFDRVGTEGSGPDKYMFGIIYGMELDKETLLPAGDTVRCLQADQPWENPLSKISRCDEGAFVFKSGGIYYMTFSFGHYADQNYGIGYATSVYPLGPWEKPKGNPLIQKDTVLGVYGPGHNSITFSPDKKELFIVYHTHVSEKDKNRVVNIDRMTIEKDGRIRILGPTRDRQLLPSGTIH
jgi:beta-xylosidase